MKKLNEIESKNVKDIILELLLIREQKNKDKEKLKRIIQSCETLEQFAIARRCIENFEIKYTGEIKDRSKSK